MYTKGVHKVPKYKKIQTELPAMSKWSAEMILGGLKI